MRSWRGWYKWFVEVLTVGISSLHSIQLALHLYFPQILRRCIYRTLNLYCSVSQRESIKNSPGQISQSIDPSKQRTWPVSTSIDRLLILTYETQD
jgi:hypothetical protein